jgi:hypothetical protein
MPPDVYAWFYILAQRLSLFLQGHASVLTGHPTLDSEYEVRYIYCRLPFPQICAYINVD